MILADTSIWIEYLNKNDKYFNHFSDLLHKNSIFTLDLIFGELLQVVCY